MKAKCALCKNIACKIDKRKKQFKNMFAIICKKCKYDLIDYTRIESCDRRSELYGKVRLYGCDMILKKNDKYYLSSACSDYDLLLTNKKWVSGLFKK